MSRPLRLALVVVGLTVLGAPLLHAPPKEERWSAVPAKNARWDTALMEYRLGQQSADGYEFQEAIQHWTRAMDSVASLGWPPERTREVQYVRLRRGMALYHTGALLEAESDLIQYAAQAPDDGRVPLLLAAVRSELSK